MKPLVLIMCEGVCEKAVFDVLLDKGLLIFDRRELLGGRFFQARNLDNHCHDLSLFLNQLDWGRKIRIIRAVDKNNSVLKINPEYREKLNIQKIDLLITSPEIEVLLLIHEDLYQVYLKKKSTLKPSEFYKQKNHSFHKNYTWFYEYFNQLSNTEIYTLFNEYSQKRLKVNPNDLTFLSLIKKAS